MQKNFKVIRKYKLKSRADGDSDKQQTERKPGKIFRCGSEYHLIVKCPKPPKDNWKRRKQVRFIERDHCASQK